MKNLPEKIYATPNFDRRWQTKAIDDESVEYTRTDVFIEKACEWMSSHLQMQYSGFSDFIKDFRQAMKGE